MVQQQFWPNQLRVTNSQPINCCFQIYVISLAFADNRWLSITIEILIVKEATQRAFAATQ